MNTGIVYNMAPNIKVNPLNQPIVDEYTALNITLPVRTEVTPKKLARANTAPKLYQIKILKFKFNLCTMSFFLYRTNCTNIQNYYPGTFLLYKISQVKVTDLPRMAYCVVS